MLRIIALLVIVSSSIPVLAFTEEDFSSHNGDHALCNDARARFPSWQDEDYEICQQVAYPSMAAIYLGKLSSQRFRVSPHRLPQFEKQFASVSGIMALSRKLVQHVTGNWTEDAPIFLSIPVEVAGSIQKIDLIAQRRTFHGDPGPTYAAWFSLAIGAKNWTLLDHSERNPLETLAKIVAQIKELTNRRCPL